MLKFIYFEKTTKFRHNLQILFETEYFFSQFKQLKKYSKKSSKIFVFTDSELEICETIR